MISRMASYKGFGTAGCEGIGSSPYDEYCLYLDMVLFLFLVVDAFGDGVHQIILDTMV
jgi:hypothetical protein